MKPRLLSAFAALSLLPACASSCTERMATEGKIRTFAPSTHFPDGKVARSPVEGTVARGELSQGQALHEIPIKVDKELLAHGQERFRIFCAPCHGLGGHGDGVIPSRGFLAPPTYHSDRLRQEPVAYFFQVATQGKGAMYGYGDRTSERDRWAIAVYIRALQLSQSFPVQELSPDERNRLGPAPSQEGSS